MLSLPLLCSDFKKLVTASWNLRGTNFSQFYKRFRSVGAISVENEKTKSISELFVEQYLAEEKKDPLLNKDELFQRTVKALEANNINLTSNVRRPLQKQERK